MNPISPGVTHDAETLGVLTMRFRGTRRDAGRRLIARDYSQVVEQLITSGSWHEMPAPEDQLPGDWMPKAFFDYWLRGSAP